MQDQDYHSEWSICQYYDFKKLLKETKEADASGEEAKENEKVAVDTFDMIVTNTGSCSPIPLGCVL